MAKRTHLLTDIQIRNWVAKGEPIARSDGDGLTFTLSSASTAAWILRYRIGKGRRRELTIGNYPDISLAAAREKARSARVAIDEGRDPAVEKQEEKRRVRAAWTVRELIADYVEKSLLKIGYAQETIDARTRDYVQIVTPHLGARQVQRITSIDIVAMISDCKRGWSASKRILTSSSKLFDHACGLQIIAANPCTGVKLSAIKGPRPTVRKRVMLLEDELRQLLPDIDFIGTENALAFRILLATCVRGIELAKAKKEHIFLDRAVWWIPDESVKTRQGFLVPLTPPVVEWFRALIEFSGESAYALPARHERRRRNQGGDTHVGETTLWAAIRRAFDRHDIEIRKFTPHDTRSTAKGHMRNMGVSRDISEIALNHTLKGMEAIYDVREEIPERREALERWTEFLVACETGAPTPTFVKATPNNNVVHLLSAA
ncbi:tyrosine-type recombinase/integrase [Ralstonia pseudosolanacearum]|uniref:tyrosine-type recombinase/integrase n=1 Tax=Ralstonia pseudosolanacearum TaxID=1310165 RepID=UPI003AAA6D8F